MTEWDSDSAKLLLSEIRLAFSDTTIPTQIATVDDWEGTDLEAAFLGRTWEDITVQDISLHKDHHLRFTLGSLLYYLPAYLTQILLEPEQTDVAFEATCGYLSPKVLDEVYGETTSTDLLELLSSQQRMAIFHFLEFANTAFSDSADPEAIRYWSQ